MFFDYYSVWMEASTARPRGRPRKWPKEDENEVKTVPGAKRGRPRKQRYEDEDEEKLDPGAKRDRGRPRKQINEDKDEVKSDPGPKRGRGRPRKQRKEDEDEVESVPGANRSPPRKQIKEDEDEVESVPGANRSPPRKQRKEDEDEVKSVPSAKRGRGRPRKQIKEDDDEVKLVPGTKRGRGQPRKQRKEDEDEVESVPGANRSPLRKQRKEDEDEVKSVPGAKRGRGRPRKLRNEDEDEVKSVPGTKRGRGRPRKLRNEDEDEVKSVPGAKRGRGRPRKQRKEDGDEVESVPGANRSPPRKQRKEDEDEVKLVPGAKRGRGRPRKQRKEDEVKSIALLGRYILKKFPSNGVFLGKVVFYECGLYRVKYEDGYSEDLVSAEIRPILVKDDDFYDGLVMRKIKLEKLMLQNRVMVGDVADKGSAQTEKEESVVGVTVPSQLNGGLLNEDGNNEDDGADLSSESVLDVETDPLPPRLQLPPSSGTIGVPEPSVSHLFSVYGFLRSFSTRLFLNPFTLDEFVGSLNCQVSNTLFDAIHISLMRVLRRQLETLSSEGSELALQCLWCHDWSLLDTLTWPVFVIQYLVISGYTKGPEWKRFYDEVLSSEYYVLPVNRKLMILQILCDDVLESKVLKTEMNTRKELEVGMDYDEDILPGETAPIKVLPRNARTSLYEDKEPMNLVSSSNAVNQPVNSISYCKDAEISGDDDVDRNRGECRLCGMDGTLLCCDGCPSAYHSRCIGVMEMHIPEGPWYCPECEVNMTGLTIAKGTSLRGAEIFGKDLYGQLFIGTCDHLLVLNIDNSEVCLRYYNQRDIPNVVQVLYESMLHRPMYYDICMALLQYWNLSENFLPHSSSTEVNMKYETKLSDPLLLPPSENIHKPVSLVKEENFQTSASLIHNDSIVSSLDTLQVITESSALDSNAIARSEKGFTVNKKYAEETRTEAVISAGSVSHQSYINYYIHGDFSASAAAKYSIISSEELKSESHASDTEKKTASVYNDLQSKAFSLEASRFFWPSSEMKLVEVSRERCGWCFSCKAQVSRGCMLNHALISATKSAMEILATCSPIRSGEGILPSTLATYILYIEKRLHGLVVGPFLNASYRNNWCEQVKHATTVSDIKPLLLKLEENIHIIAFSGDWVKLMEDCLVEFSIIQSATSTLGTTSDGSNDSMWWRGGKLNKFIFQNAALPKPIVRKAVCQGGWSKISDIFYVDSSKIPKRNRQLVWRSAVQMSRNASHLALQVRYLDSYIRWSDLIRPEANIHDGKGQEIQASAFRNAKVCDKKLVDGKNSYGIAFGSQKHLPVWVAKSVIEKEQDPLGQEKYWFFETHIPLYLVKEYEEHYSGASRLHGRRLKGFAQRYW